MSLSVESSGALSYKLRKKAREREVLACIASENIQDGDVLYVEENLHEFGGGLQGKCRIVRTSTGRVLGIVLNAVHSMPLDVIRLVQVVSRKH